MSQLDYPLIATKSALFGLNQHLQQELPQVELDLTGMSQDNIVELLNCYANASTGLIVLLIAIANEEIKPTDLKQILIAEHFIDKVE
jgi:hypothetical protein